jgi:hypothetical protein
MGQSLGFVASIGVGPYLATSRIPACGGVARPFPIAHNIRIFVHRAKRLLAAQA